MVHETMLFDDLTPVYELTVDNSARSYASVAKRLEEFVKNYEERRKIYRSYATTSNAAIKDCVSALLNNKKQESSFLDLTGAAIDHSWVARVSLNEIGCVVIRLAKEMYLYEAGENDD